MKKTVCLVLSLTVILSVMLGFSAFLVQAEKPSASIGLSPKKDSYAVGEQITVTGTVSWGNSIIAVTGNLTYNTSVLQYVSGGGSVSGGTVNIFDFECSGENRRSYNITFKVVGEGDCYLKFFAECADGNSTSSGTGGYTIKAANPVAPPPTSSNTPTAEASGNANLSSLTVNGVALSPKFSAATTAYQATVGNEVTSCKITARAQDGSAKIAGTGNWNLAVGANSRQITVTAANGTKKTYTVSITRAAEGEQPEAEPTVDPLAATVGEKNYHIAADISEVTIPTGLTSEEGSYNGQAVGVFRSKDQNYEVYWLTDDATGEGEYFVYNEVRDEFKVLPYMNHMGMMYIFAEPEEVMEAPEGYYETTLTLGNSEITVWGNNNPKKTDFYMVYCFVNGDYGFYSYDSLEGTMQRAPDFALQKVEVKKPVEKNTGFLYRIKKMPARGKIVLGVLTAAVLCTVALIVLLIVRGVRERRLESVRKYEDYRNSIFSEIENEMNPNAVSDKTKLNQ